MTKKQKRIVFSIRVMMWLFIVIACFAVTYGGLAAVIAVMATVLAVVAYLGLDDIDKLKDKDDA